ncbi:MAG: N-acetyltransferase [Siphoviridae sp. ctdEk19]|nr:MAG: N-acetyltransferase [Siphoviridae sp. ctdEk19]
MKLAFARERLGQILPEAFALWQAHWEETEGYRAGQGFQPNLEQYVQLDETGQFVEFTARNEAGQLVGHLGFILHMSRHTCRPNAVEDYFYLAPEARKGLNAVSLLRFAVNWLQEAGMAQIGMSSKLTNDIEPLLRRVGFQYVAKFFVMDVLEKPNVLRQSKSPDTA